MAADAGDLDAPSLSALIVNYNGGPMLAESIRRLLGADDGLALEVIVADNGSTDGSLEALRDEPRVRILELGENLGFGAANNRAAATARSNRLLLLNSDAWPRPGALSSLLQKLNADPRLGLVAPRLVYPDGRHQFHWAPTTSVLGEALQLVRNRFESFAFNHRLHRLRPGTGWFSAACALVRRRAFESVGGFDEGFFLYFEDVDLCLRLRRGGWNLAEAPDATVVHVKGGSQPGGQSEVLYRRSQLLFYARHRPAWEQAFLRAKLRVAFGKLEEPRRSQLLALLEESVAAAGLD